MTRRAWRLPAGAGRLAAVVGLALGAAGPVLAGTSAAGEEAPEAAGGRWLPEPEEDEYDVLALRGDAVVVLAWDAEDRPVLTVFGRLIAAAKELPGLHVRCFVPVGRAAARVDVLSAAPEVKRERAAARPWRTLRPQLAGRDPEDQRAALERLLADSRLPGTRAAGSAREALVVLPTPEPTAPSGGRGKR